MNDRVLDAQPRPRRLHRVRARRAAERLPGRPVAHLPLDFVGSPVDTAAAAGPRARPWASPPAASSWRSSRRRASGRRRPCAPCARRSRACGCSRGRRTRPRGALLLAAADVAVALEHTPGGAAFPRPSCAPSWRGSPRSSPRARAPPRTCPRASRSGCRPAPPKRPSSRRCCCGSSAIPPARARGRPGPRARRRAARPRAAARALLALAGDVERSSAEALRAFDAGRRGGTLLARRSRRCAGAPVPRAAELRRDRAARRPPAAGGDDGPVAVRRDPRLQRGAAPAGDARARAGVSRGAAGARDRRGRRRLDATRPPRSRAPRAPSRVLRHAPNRGKGYAVRARHARRDAASGG